MLQYLEIPKFTLQQRKKYKKELVSDEFFIGSFHVVKRTAFCQVAFANGLKI